MRLRRAALLVLAGAALATPAAPARAAACGSTSGVTVVVDFASLGGGEQTRCTDVDPPSGLAALHDVGDTTTRAAQQPGYFVCRINGKPASDPCQRTSPANAYWSYWHAKPGGTWTYSTVGAADFDPKPGTVEGWAFGAGKPPSSAPPAAAAPSPQPSRSAAAAAPRVTPAYPAVSPAPPRSGSPAPRPTPAADIASAPSVSPTPTPSGTASPPAADPAPGTATSRPNRYAGPVVAGVLVLLIAGAGIRRLQLRRRDDGG